MANEEQLRLLKEEGVEAWNAWRQKAQSEEALDWMDLLKVDLSGADLREADLSMADLREAYFIRANLKQTDLKGTNLIRANLRAAYLRGADLREAYLKQTDLMEADLRRANLSMADLRGADLIRAELSEANLKGAELGVADLRGANLNMADLKGADLSWARVGQTVFGSNDLSEVKGLDAVIHRGPSTIGIDTLYRSRGNIPESFLKGAGVPDTFIEYAKSLVGKAIEYYSCFISYSNRDQDFTERLYTDLQSKSIRTWFAPEDLKIGDKFHLRIDESIRIHDKLLLILSKTSVASSWVEREVLTALEQEDEQGKTVLFPIRLDNVVMDIKTGWPAQIRRSRHIGDFTHWKDHDQYQQSFERLLRDLKASEASSPSDSG